MTPGIIKVTRESATGLPGSIFLEYVSKNTFLLQIIQLFLSTLHATRKIAPLRAAFSSSCGGQQPSAATVGPFGPNNRALQAHLKFSKFIF